MTTLVLLVLVVDEIRALGLKRCLGMLMLILRNIEGFEVNVGSRARFGVVIFLLVCEDDEEDSCLFCNNGVDAVD